MNSTPPSKRSIGWLAAVVLPLVVVVASFGVLRYAVAGSIPFVRTGDPQESNPFAKRAPFVDPAAPVAQAAVNAASPEDRKVLKRMAKVPAGLWLTPEKLPVGNIGAYVSQLASQAAAANQVPVFVIYGITDRDCGSESAGGLPADQYLPWVSEITKALKDADDAVAIVEPDALALADKCGDLPQRTALIKGAVDLLVAARVVTYVDAAHSDWIGAANMAARLKAVGIETTRGFATNVSNYYGNSQERTYALELSQALGGSHFVIDSGRNGAGSSGEWCNPSGRALGIEPGYVDDGSAQDAYLWVKPPGESDGACNGGPAAGSWWTEGAVALARQAGW
ncbi:MAG: hypothetical protein JWP10_704 [Nocardioidaceae bacterium]|nr:hypothetical protein [Nocardioidaceae bacterium]